MSYKNAFIAELKHEAALTKKILQRVPLDKKDWQPHEKSMALGRLATHIAENFGWAHKIITITDYDFLTNPPLKLVAGTTEELLQIMDTNVANAINSIENCSEEEMDKIWTVRRGEQVVFQLPKKAAIRSWAFSHNIHHRGQLTVYLRLLNVAVPGMYGPTADEAF
jgi:uncharacterized damage-inducible protein DinB